jgi:hypothetical protein
MWIWKYNTEYVYNKIKNHSPIKYQEDVKTEKVIKMHWSGKDVEVAIKKNNKNCRSNVQKN